MKRELIVSRATNPLIETECRLKAIIPTSKLKIWAHKGSHKLLCMETIDESNKNIGKKLFNQ